jgi:hypothetical protein
MRGIDELRIAIESKIQQKYRPKEDDMNRREFAKMALGAAATGVLASKVLLADEKAADKADKHVCKGMNSCKGQGGCHTAENTCAGQNSCKGKGGCATSAHHSCKGSNACKGQGGCKSGDNGCAGKNSCKGKGGCAVPMKAAKGDKKGAAKS